MVYIGLYRQNMKTLFLPETTRHRALKCGMYYHLVDLYHVCSNYVPGAINGPTPGGHMFGIGLHRKNM